MKRDHALYNRWHKLLSRGLLSEEWNLFENFVKDVPENTSKLLRKDKTKPHGKDNTEIYLKTDEPLQQRKNRIQREHRVKRPDLYKGYSLQKDYGITLIEYQAKLESQGNVCAICGQPEQVKRNGQVKALAVDHDHATGKVRGILCQACNKALGLLKDDVNLFQKSIEYIQTYKD